MIDDVSSPEARPPKNIRSVVLKLAEDVEELLEVTIAMPS